MRDMLKMNPNAREVVNLMTTSKVGTVLPDFVTEFGEDKKVDVSFSPSHSLFVDGVPGAKMTGMYMDKNGNFKMVLNIPAAITVESSPGNWEDARTAYMTFVCKFKISTSDAEDPTRK